jgi:hypothetical protein
METATTILVVALDTTAFFGSFAPGAFQLKSFSLQNSTDVAIFIVCEPDLRRPVDTNNMCPEVSIA